MSTLGTLLHRAAMSGDVTEVQRLINSGENTNAQNDFGWTPLHIAAGLSSQIATALVSNGSNTEAKDRNGWTPLYYAIISDEEDNVRTLIGLGADIDATDSKSKTVFNFAISCGKIGPAQMLLDAGAKTTPEERAFLEHLKVNGLPTI